MVMPFRAFIVQAVGILILMELLARILVAILSLVILLKLIELVKLVILIP